MPNYRFIGLTPRFYPDERGDDGRSLMALPGGDDHDWEHTPDDGLWVLAEDAPPATPEPVQETPPAEVPPADPEPVQEAPADPPAPVDTPADPEPAPAPVAPEEPVPDPEPDPAPVTEPDPPQAVRDWFAAMGQTPPARA